MSSLLETLRKHFSRKSAPEIGKDSLDLSENAPKAEKKAKKGKKSGKSGKKSGNGGKSGKKDEKKKEKKKSEKAKSSSKKKEKKKKKKEDAGVFEVTPREEKTGTYFANRELSWLKFNTRVLEEAENKANPFCERLSFASIYQSNLDEFFMVRFGSLYDQMMLSEDIRDNKTNMTCEEQLLEILKAVKRLEFRKDALFADIKRGLEEHGIQIYSYAEMNERDKEFLGTYFETSVRPILSPQIVGPSQPFPFLSNKEIYAVVVMTKAGKANVSGVDTTQKEKKAARSLGIVRCLTNELPRLVKIPGHENRYMLMEELILHFIPDIFNRYNIISKSLIRLIRNADIDPDEEMYDDDSDFRAVMEKLIQKRTRLMPVKLAYSRLMEKDVLRELGRELGLAKRQMFHQQAPLDLSFLTMFSDILRNDASLFYPKFTQKTPRWYDSTCSMFERVREKDRLLFYPYDSIDPFLSFLNEAASDPLVRSIKMTLYRVASGSKVIEALERAAINGKEVLALVELRARFDEESNIEWSRSLEKAGVKVIYGLDQLKVHSKLCLVARGDTPEYFTQIGTGNYNEKTARLYTDFCLMTADQDIGREAEHVFSLLVQGQVMEHADILMVAPRCLRNKIIEKIDRQIMLAESGRGGYVGVKINSLTDKVLIEKLVEASKAGVHIDLIVRGACCLISQIPGETQNIHVRSIVGRYLEHSRIYIFGGVDDYELYISSADFMTRNTTRRVEVAVPVLDPDVKARIYNIFDILLRDNVNARIQRADGEYVPAVAGVGEPRLGAMRYFEENDI